MLLCTHENEECFKITETRKKRRFISPLEGLVVELRKASIIGGVEESSEESSDSYGSEMEGHEDMDIYLHAKLTADGFEYIVPNCGSEPEYSPLTRENTPDLDSDYAIALEEAPIMVEPLHIIKSQVSSFSDLSSEEELAAEAV